MAKREALRELQSRLADRMLAARSEPRARSWLAVECRGQGLLFPLEQAGEIFSMVPLVAVPHTQPWFAGVANLRGGLYAAIDLAAFLGLPATGTEGGREQARLVALNPAVGLHCALLVDRLAGLRHAGQLSAHALAPGSAGPARPAFAGEPYHDGEGRVWQEILLAALAEDEQFLAIARPQPA